MSERLSNEQNLINYKKRKYLRYAIIIFAFLTMILAIADLFTQNTILLILALLFFIVTTVLNKYRDSIKIDRKDELEDIKKEIEENKKKYQRGVQEEKKEPVKKKKVKEEKVEGNKTTTKKKSTTKKKTTSKNTNKKSTNKNS
jgi:Ca2+/Na+ antiporter